MREALEKTNKTVDYVSFDKTKFEGSYIRLPERSELTSEINESLVIEYYKR
jgi:small subunit ribosomal protein S4